VRLAADAVRADAQAETQKLRTALLNSLSHDLRTPLTGIRGAAGTLRTAWDKLSAEARGDLLAAIEEDTVRMTRFLANITEMTRLETGEIIPRLQRVDVATAIEAAVARVPGIGAVEQAIPDGIAVHADADLLEQVLVNVIENAAKYGPEGGIVRFAAEAAGDDVTISLADDGPGIPEHDRPHVFDSFYRALRGDRIVPGTGLGLAIARGLIHAMGGTISADAAGGAVIRIVLPRAS